MVDWWLVPPTNLLTSLGGTPPPIDRVGAANIFVDGLDRLIEHVANEGAIEEEAAQAAPAAGDAAGASPLPSTQAGKRARRTRAPPAAGADPDLLRGLRRVRQAHVEWTNALAAQQGPAAAPGARATTATATSQPEDRSPGAHHSQGSFPTLPPLSDGQGRGP